MASEPSGFAAGFLQADHCGVGRLFCRHIFAGALSQYLRGLRYIENVVDDLKCETKSGVNGGDDDARLDRDQVNADQRDANPRVNDDAFIQHAVEHVYQTGSAGCSLNSHVVCFLSSENESKLLTACGGGAET